MAAFAVLSIVPAWADDYVFPYLIFSDAEGTQTTVSVAELEMTFANGQLVAKNGDGTTSISLATLASMAFSKDGTVTPTPTPQPQANGLAFSSETAETRLNEEVKLPVLSNPNNLSVTWTSSDETVATVDENGNVTIIAVGTVTITATFAGNDNYLAGAVSYTLTVDQPDGLLSVAGQTPVKVFTASGIYVGAFDTLNQAKATLKRGLYVVKTNNKNYKLNIR